MLAVLLAATACGAWKGVAWQVASLGAIVASYVVAYRYRDAVAAWIPATAPWRVFLAMLLLYVGTSLAIWIVFRLVSRLIDRMKLKEFDRQIGALLGLAKGMVLCVIITLFAVTLLGGTAAAGDRQFAVRLLHCGVIEPIAVGDPGGVSRGAQAVSGGV